MAHLRIRDKFLVFVAMSLACGVTKLLHPKHTDYWLDDHRIRYPHKPNTIPYPYVLLAGTLPFLLEALEMMFRATRLKGLLPIALNARIARTWHNFSLALIGFLTQYFFVEFTKLTVGALRPDFLDRCDPLPVGRATGLHDWTCQRDASNFIDDGRKSFPSGHTSTAFYFASFYSVLLLTNVETKRLRLEYGRQMAVFFNLCLAMGVGITRLLDYRHHAVDVVAGLVLGIFFGVVFGYWSRMTYTDEEPSAPPTNSTRPISPVRPPRVVGHAGTTVAAAASWNDS